MESHDVQDLREVLEVVSDKVPALLRGLRDVLYSKESAENMAESVGTFYKRLVESGIPKEDALEMARGYMINLRDIMGKKGINIGDFTRRHDDDDEGDEN
ncbi:hypothetical protein J7K60_01695 [Candidatus Bipolaricaulota bacterium]|nr:hypothetical protein [Candidatus Bipolaricaulota bacterium]HHR85240.1 hypothetical protein [Candidatus Acetothermia bacterium]